MGFLEGLAAWAAAKQAEQGAEPAAGPAASAAAAEAPGSPDVAGLSAAFEAVTVEQVAAGSTAGSSSPGELRGASAEDGGGGGQQQAEGASLSDGASAIGSPTELPPAAAAEPPELQDNASSAAAPGSYIPRYPASLKLHKVHAKATTLPSGPKNSQFWWFTKGF